MAALGTTISAQELALAGITGALSTALLGLTWLEAKELLTVVLVLSGANSSLDRAGVQSYSINGKQITASMQQLKDALAMVNAGLSMLGSGGGPIMMAVDL
jgi:hypothetical protein